MSWKDINEGGTNNTNLTLQAGESATVHIIGEPKSFWEHFFPSIQKSAICPHKGCAACNEETTKARLRHAFVVYDLGDDTVKVWAVSNTVALTVKNIWESYGGDLSEVDLDIKRTGTGLNTKYAVVPKKTKYNDTLIEGVELPNLDTIFTPATDEEIQSLLQSEIGDEATPSAAVSPKRPTPKTTKKAAKPVEESEAKEESSDEAKEPKADTQPKKTAADKISILRRILPKFSRLDTDTKREILSAFGKQTIAQLTAEELAQAEEMM